MATMHCTNCGTALRKTDLTCPKCGSKDRTNIAQDEAVFTEIAAMNEAANKLAEKHYQVETGLTHIFRVSDKLDLTEKVEVEVIRAQPIRLLEINENTVPVGVEPLYFGPVPHAGIHYPSIIVEVTPEEFDKIQADEIKLPDGWKIGPLIPKPAGDGGK